MSRKTLKYNDLITLEDVKEMDICNSIYWERRFKKLFPKGCKLNYTNIKKFFGYSHKNWRYIKMIGADRVLDREFNMHVGIKALIEVKGTDIQLQKFENEVDYTSDWDLPSKPNHAKFFKAVNNFFKSY